MEANGFFLVLKDSDGKVIAICKKVGNSFRVYCPQQIYQEQKVGTKHKGNEYYLYATISSRREVVFVHEPDTVAFSIISGPRNSFEKYLMTSEKEGYFATWKYSKQLNRVEIVQPGHDAGLVIFLVVIADLMDTDAQMSKLGKTVAKASVYSVTGSVSVLK